MAGRRQMGLQRAPPVAVPRYRSQRLVITVAAPSDAGPGVRARLPAVRLAIFLDGVRLAECAQRHQGTGNGQSRLACGRVLLATHGHAHYQCQHCCLAARTGLQCHWRWVHLQLTRDTLVQSPTRLPQNALLCSQLLCASSDA